MQIGLIFVGLFLLFIIWTLIEQKQLITTKYIIKSDKLPKKFDNTSFVILSDLHNDTFGKNNKRLVKKINQLSPEFIVVAGDMINKNSVSYPSNAYILLDKLARKYKIYYAYGNHEQRVEHMLSQDYPERNENLSSTWVEYKNLLSKKKITFLNNKSVVITKGKEKLRITGLSIDEKYFEHFKSPTMDKEYLNSILSNKSEDNYEILIAHNPVYFRNYADRGANLIISGHLHGGLVRLPFLGGVISPQVRFFPKFTSGIYQEGGQQMVVSRGLGSHSMMPRLFNVPEIVQITLKYD